MNKPQIAESTAVAVHEQTAVAPITPMDMLNRAVSSGADIEVLEKLMALNERWETGQAKKAFDEAMAAAKSEIPVIAKNRHVGFDSRKPGAARTDYWHEDIAEIARTVDPILSKHGLSYRFRARSVINEPIEVTCIVSHRMGHSEENTLCGGRDDTGNKNSLQQIGSTITYLQRYTLKAALGLAAARDDDGRASNDDADESKISAEQIAALQSLIVEHGKDIGRFCKFMKVEKIEDIPAVKFDDAVTAIKFKKPEAK